MIRNPMLANDRKEEKIPLRQNKYKTCQIKQWNHLIDKQQALLFTFTPESAKG